MAKRAGLVTYPPSNTKINAIEFPIERPADFKTSQMVCHAGSQPAHLI